MNPSKWFAHRIRRLTGTLFLLTARGRVKRMEDVVKYDPAGKSAARSGLYNTLRTLGIDASHLTDDEMIVRLKLFSEEFCNRPDVTLDALARKMEQPGTFTERKVHRAKAVKLTPELDQAIEAMRTMARYSSVSTEDIEDFERMRKEAIRARKDVDDAKTDES